MWTCKEIVTICKVSLVMVQSDGRRPGGILTLPPADSCFALLGGEGFSCWILGGGGGRPKAGGGGSGGGTDGSGRGGGGLNSLPVYSFLL